MAIVENNEIRIENNDISGHILPALFSNRLTLVSHYSAFSPVRRTDANVLNCSKHSRPSCERRRMQNNAIREWSYWRIMRGECDPKYRYSLIVSHYSLHSPHWKRGIRYTVNALLDKDKMYEHGLPTEKRNADTNVTNRTISGLSGKPRTTPIQNGPKRQIATWRNCDRTRNTPGNAAWNWHITNMRPTGPICK